jgi:NADH-quinone oxidoreductase subunit L
MSQIGYMFCGVGIGAYSAGMFLLIAHAFFKALLFLGAGVVIHALDDEQDMRRMGGMRRYLPYTAVLMWIGGLALAGMPPFAGFFAKDQILADALARGGWVGGVVFGLGAAGALVTGLYTFRMIFMVFSGKPTGFARDHAPRHTAHGEGPFSMLWTIGVLAAGTVLVGFLEIPGGWHLVQTFLSPGVPVLLEPTGTEEWVASLLSVALGLAGILTANAQYARPTDAPARIGRSLAPVPRLLEERLGFDAAYEWAFYRPAAALGTAGAQLWEGRVTSDGLSVVGGVLRWVASLLSLTESGLVRAYAIAFGLGLAAISVWFLAQGIA